MTDTISMLDKLSQRGEEMRAPDSTISLVANWALAGFTILLMLYLFIEGLVDTSLNPVILSAILVAGLTAGYAGTRQEMTNERIQELKSDFVVRFVFLLACGTIGVTVALWYTRWFGYLAVAIIGVASASIVAQTLLYVRSTGQTDR